MEARDLPIEYREDKDLPREQVIRLYSALDWSSARKPDRLMEALRGCHAVVTAWEGETLVGLASAISDGALVVYYVHVLVLREYQRRGIGREMMAKLMRRYEGFHPAQRAGGQVGGLVLRELRTDAVPLSGHVDLRRRRSLTAASISSSGTGLPSVVRKVA